MKSEHDGARRSGPGPGQPASGSHWTAPVAGMGKELLERLALLAALILAAVAVGFLVSGCGGQSGGRSSAGGDAGQALAVAQSGGRVVPASPASTPPGEPQGERPAAVTPESVPPDVAASVMDTLVAPGEVVEITAEASADVVAVMLADGIGKPQPLAYDSTASVWHAFYRVPMRTSADRLGLSVTAKNGVDRWRRVWLFLSVQREKPAEAPEPECSSPPGAGD